MDAPLQTIRRPLCQSAARFFASKNQCAIYTCTSCAVQFVHPMPESVDVYTEDYFSSAHGGFGYTDYDADKEPMRSVFEEYMRRIALLIPPAQHASLLDVGAATGFFIRIARDAGFAVSGVEISDYAAARARAQGLDVRTGTLADMPQSSYDVVTMLDVIEHTQDPRAELERAAALLKKGGLLVINTPDSGSLYARVLGKRWHLFVPPEHLFYFNRPAMRSLLEAEGFRVHTMTTIGKKITIPYICKTLFAWQRIALWKSLADRVQSSFLSRVSIPINLFDSMFVIAEKL
jgi:SAM-dependent methyltransferase